MSYRKLDEWTRMQLSNNNSDRSGLEQDYIDHFVLYIKRMCDTKVKVMDRLQHIKVWCIVHSIFVFMKAGAMI